MLALPILAACTITPGPSAGAPIANYPEATPFDAAADATTDLVAARVESAAGGTLTLAIFGGNWCHDSRALAGWLETPRFQALLQDRYAVAYIDAGVPQIGEGRNLELAEELGVLDITGTPTMLVLDSGGNLLNSPQDARSWRNASTRSEEEIYSWLESWLAEDES